VLILRPDTLDLRPGSIATNCDGSCWRWGIEWGTAVKRKAPRPLKILVTAFLETWQERRI